MENQHQKIKGYRDLSQEEIDLMNEIKTKAEEVNTLVKKLEAIQKSEADQVRDQTDKDDFNEWVNSLNDARRWTAIAKTQVQQGFMALIRAVARPTSF